MKNIITSHKTAINNFGDFESFQDTFSYDPEKEVLRESIAKQVEEYQKLHKIEHCASRWDNEPDFKFELKNRSK